MIVISDYNSKSISDCISYLNSKDKPVIFWDTCSLLDIIRIAIPSRNYSFEDIDKLVKIRDLIINDVAISLSSEICVSEFNTNIIEVVKDYDKQLKDISRNFNQFTNILNNSKLSVTLPKIDLLAYKLIELYSSIAKAIIDKTFFISANNDLWGAAGYRVVNKVTPANKKNEYKDCAIWETCFQTRVGMSNKWLFYTFFSSNVEDYAGETRLFSDDILKETYKENIYYSFNFGVLFNHLKSVDLI